MRREIERSPMELTELDSFALAARTVFQTMLGCTIRRRPRSPTEGHLPTFDVSGVIGLSGKVEGTVVLSVPTRVALAIARTMLDIDVGEANSDVTDAVAELTNMIAGVAKTSLPQYAWSLGLPYVVTTRSAAIHDPLNMLPRCALFDTPWGPMALAVGLDPADSRAAVGATSAS
jgi:chemotaxis protein CheX